MAIWDKAKVLARIAFFLSIRETRHNRGHRLLGHMKPGFLVARALLCLAATSTMAASRPLGADEAGVVGGWSGTGPVQGLTLQAVVDIGGCLKLAPQTWLISDHQDIDHPPIYSVLKLKPGRYAISGVGWDEPWFDGYDMVGVSRPDGDMWIVELAPGLVTDIGVWPIRSPYRRKYFAGPPIQNEAAATAAADGFGPLVSAHWARARVIDSDKPCPTMGSASE